MTEKVELKPSVQAPRAPMQPWLARWAALACAGVGLLGMLALFVSSLVTESFWAMPPLYLTIPLCVATIGLAIASLIRREQGARYLVAGVSAALASIILGWVVVTVVVLLLAWALAHAIGEVL